MNTLLTTSVVSVSLFAAVWLGTRLRRILPAEHLSADSKDAVKLAMGLVATMTAMVLGLLVSSAKTSYDTTRTQVMEKAAKYHLLDRVLEIYGQPAAVVRAGLHESIESEMRRLWPEDGHVSAPTKAQNQAGNAFYLALLRLEARDDTERALKVQAASLAVELGSLLSLMEAESTTSISKPMLVVVVLWLVMIFFSFSLIAPPNATTSIALFISAVCTAGAIFLILEMDIPFGGLMRISNEPMVSLLRDIGK